MEQAYIELHSELKIEIVVFLSIDSARKWLRERIAAKADSTGS